MTTVRTLADPMFASIFNKGETTMNDIICETTEERTTDISTPPVDNVSTPNQPIQGVSGASYAPMDTSPQPKESRLDQLTTLLNETLKQLVIELNKQTHAQSQPDLADTVEQVLTQAVWFTEMVKESIEENHDIEDLVNDRVDDSIGDKVDEYFNYNFSIEDHCDLNDIVGDAIYDRLDGIVAEKLEELLAEKLKNANITVSF